MKRTPGGQISPHGGKLVNAFVPAEHKEEILRRAAELPSLHLTERQVSDLELIGMGGFSPLEGFMCRRDYESVLEDMRLSDGLPWTIPITLAVQEQDFSGIKEGSETALKEKTGRILATLHIQEIYAYDKHREAQLVYGTRDSKHPGVALLYAQGDTLLGGTVSVLNYPLVREFAEYRMEPLESRRLFLQRGWQTVVGFQTRNPIHRAHEYLHKCVMESHDGLFLHPVVGQTKDDDIPAAVRIKCYQEILKGYYPTDRVIFAVNPAFMRYAGPREAIFHAIIRKNYGCTHFIVGRDHAGVGNYYHTYDAHRIFSRFRPDELDIMPIFFDHAFYCSRCGTLASVKTCPHGEGASVTLSGTEVRRMLRENRELPHEFTRPEVAAVLVEWVRQTEKTVESGFYTESQRRAAGAS
jgi:sulfate adenylyltransferase